MIILAYPSVRIECYGLNKPGFEFQQRQKIALLQNIPTSSGAHLPYLSMDCGDLPGMMLPGGETDLSSQSIAEVENVWSFISTLPQVIQGVYKDKFNLTFTHCRGCWLNSRIGLHSLEIPLVSAGNRTRFLWPPACGLVTILTVSSQLPPVNLRCTYVSCRVACV